MGEKMAGQFCLWFRLPRKPRFLWHAAQICDMGDGFTSPPRKACCGFFRPKNPTASAGNIYIYIYIYVRSSSWSVTSLAEGTHDFWFSHTSFILIFLSAFSISAHTNLKTEKQSEMNPILFHASTPPKSHSAVWTASLLPHTPVHTASLWEFQNSNNLSRQPTSLQNYSNFMLGRRGAPGRKRAWCSVSMPMSVTDRPAAPTNATASYSEGLGDRTDWLTFSLLRSRLLKQSCNIALHDHNLCYTHIFQFTLRHHNRASRYRISFIHSPRSLSYNRSTASSKQISPHSVICCFRFQFPVPSPFP